SLIGHVARYIPSSTCEISTKIHRPCINKYWGTGSMYRDADIVMFFAGWLRELFYVTGVAHVCMSGKL
ncbi:MAG: hypothetical protein ACI30O_07080, partial [Muribaculaceae bacterium]